jgi:hypothetical protein
MHTTLQQIAGEHGAASVEDADNICCGSEFTIDCHLPDGQRRADTLGFVDQ